MTDEQAAGADEPVNIYATGPSDVADQVTVERSYDTNEAAYADKQDESIKAQTAPNVTTDVDLAREAYGDDYNRPKLTKVIGATEGGDPVFARGAVAVDAQGHALGHASDPERAVALKERLMNNPNAKDADRYPVTAEARAADTGDANGPAGQQPDERNDPDSYDEMTVQRLTDELRARGLPVTGAKAELVERLRANDRGE
jgi:hypothetical protein